MRKRIFFCIGIVLLILVCWGWFRIMRPHRNVEGEVSIARLTAETLYRDFLNNESDATKKWVGKVIEVDGVVLSLSEAGTYLSVELRGSQEGGINCSILKTDLSGNKKIEVGNTISLKGKCTGYLMDVNMVDCVVIQ